MTMKTATMQSAPADWPRLSSVLGRFKASGTMNLAARAAALAAKGVDVIPLGGGEPDFALSAHIKAAAVAMIESGRIGYTGVHGTPELRQAIVEKFERDNGLTFAADEIAVSDGSKQVIYNALVAILDPGDEVIVPAPYWVCYPEMVALAGGRTAFVSTSAEHGFKLQPSDLKGALGPRTKAVILNSPNNPTGAVYARQDFEVLAQVLEHRPDIWIIADDLYEQLRYDGRPYATFAHVARLRDRVLTVSGVSKTYAMTGWRIGFGGGPAELVKAMAKIQTQSTSCPSAISQRAAAAALGGPQDDVAKRLAVYDERRQMMVSGLNAIPGLSCSAPEGAYLRLRRLPKTGWGGYPRWSPIEWRRGRRRVSARKCTRDRRARIRVRCGALSASHLCLCNRSHSRGACTHRRRVSPPQARRGNLN